MTVPACDQFSFYNITFTLTSLVREILVADPEVGTVVWNIRKK